VSGLVRQYDHPQGLRPGMRHDGQFKAGDDERRFTRKTSDGRSIASIAREYTQEAVEFLYAVMRGEHGDAKVGDRVRSSELLLAYGWGRPVTSVQMEVTAVPKEVGNLTRADLQRLIAGELPRPSDEASDIDASTVASAVPRN
jgi:hypothetical protein